MVNLESYAEKEGMLKRGNVVTTGYILISE